MSFNRDERLPPIRTALLAYPPRASVNLGSASLPAVVAPQTMKNEDDKHSHRAPIPSIFLRSLDSVEVVAPVSGLSPSESRFGPISTPSPTIASLASTPSSFVMSRYPHPEAVPSSSFQGLVVDMKTHPSFALLVKKVFELCTGRDVIVPDYVSNLSNTDRDARHLSSFADDHGVETACSRSSSLDMFFAGALTAIEAIIKESAGVHFPPILRETVVACKQHANGKRSSTLKERHPDMHALLPLGNYVRPGPAYPSLSRSLGPGPRPKLRTEAREILEEWFNRHYDNPYPTDKEKRELAKMCDVRLNQVNNFFGNKRMRIKRKAMAIQRDCTANRSDSNQQSIDPSSVLAPRAKWRAVVLSQTHDGDGVSGTEDGTAKNVRDGKRC